MAFPLIGVAIIGSVPVVSVCCRRARYEEDDWKRLGCYYTIFSEVRLVDAFSRAFHFSNLALFTTDALISSATLSLVIITGNNTGVNVIRLRKYNAWNDVEELIMV